MKLNPDFDLKYLPIHATALRIINEHLLSRSAVGKLFLSLLHKFKDDDTAIVNEELFIGTVLVENNMRCTVVTSDEMLRLAGVDAAGCFTYLHGMPIIAVNNSRLPVPRSENDFQCAVISLLVTLIRATGHSLAGLLN